MHIKTHVRTSKLAIKKIPGLYPRAQIQQGTEREWGKGRGREKERRGKGKGRRHDRRKGMKESMGNSDGGNCAIAPRGIDATAAPQVLAYICSGTARNFLAVRAYAVWRPNRGDWQFTFR